MRSTCIRKLYAYMLSVAVLFTMGMSFEAINNHTAYIPSNSSAEIDLNEQLADISLELQDPVQTPEEVQQNNEVIVEPTVAVANYVVTADFLNVRACADANATSEIIDVVKKGSILEVTETEDNGWLKLQVEGYVHGKYAQLISDPTAPKDSIKESAQVKILSVENTTVENDIPETQPSDNNQHAGLPSKPTSLVKSESSLTEENITQIFEGTALSGYELEKAILEIEQEYGINAYFTIAVMKLESGHGKSQIAQNKNNMFGLNAIDSDTYNNAYSFETKGESVQKFGQLISDYYLDQGYTSVEKVAKKYCLANPKWPILVKSIMESDYNKLL